MTFWHKFLRSINECTRRDLPLGGVAPALIDRALDDVSSGFHWDLGNIIAPAYAHAVVGIAREVSR